MAIGGLSAVIYKVYSLLDSLMSVLCRDQAV